MTSPTTSLARSWWQVRASPRLSAGLAEPLLRNAYALVVNAGLTALLGMVFWFVAARAYPSDVVGVGAATLAAMTTLSTIAQLNLASALSRFLPVAGPRRRTLLRRCYGAAVTMAAAAGVVFVLGTPWWSPSLRFLQDDLRLGIWFVVALVLWSLFVVQDGALSGLRRSTWVVGKNTVHAVAKIGFLLVPVVHLSGQGIFMAWTIPVAPVLVVVHLLMVRKALDRNVFATDGAEPPPTDRVVARFVAADYVVALASTGLTGLLPIIVLEGVGAREAAYFTLAFSIAYSVYLVSRSMATSLVVEGAASPARLGEISYRVALHSAALLVPLVIGVFLTAPLLLGIFGSEYAAGGSTTLRLLVLAVLPSAVVVVYMAVARVRRHMRSLVAVSVSVNATALVLVLMLMGPYGLEGVAWAWLITQSGAAAFVLIGVLGPLWLPMIDRRLLAPLVWPLRRVKAFAHRRGLRRHVARRLPEVVDRAHLGFPCRVRGVLPTVGDVSVALVECAGRSGVLKVSRSARGDEALEHAVQAARTLRADVRLSAWCAVVPRTLASVHLHDGRAAVVEEEISGLGGGDAILQPGGEAAVVAAVERTITVLHETTGHLTVVDDALLERWVDAPIAVLAGASASGDQAALLRLRDELRRSLKGSRAHVAWTHGDLSPGNLVLDPVDLTLRGLLDWERAMPDGLPEVDLRHLTLTVRMSCRHRELGELVCDELTSGRRPGTDQVLTVLAWLHHVSGVYEKTSRYPAHSMWWARNVAPVLAWAEGPLR